jgi:hypothetical protein
MPEHKPKSWKSSLFLSLVSLLILIGISVLVLFAFGRAQGEEFSPDDFSRRSFEYVRLPGLNWVVRGIEYQDLTGDIEKSLQTSGWISTTPAKTWHLCREAQAVQPPECDARFLVDMLQKKSRSHEHLFYWDEWNEEYPELAKVFWPLIARMARDELYLPIPEIMQLAIDLENRTEIPSSEAFEAELKQQLVAAYQRFAEIDQANGLTVRSQTRLQRAAEFQTE